MPKFNRAKRPDRTLSCSRHNAATADHRIGCVSAPSPKPTPIGTSALASALDIDHSHRNGSAVRIASASYATTSLNGRSPCSCRSSARRSRARESRRAITAWPGSWKAVASRPVMVTSMEQEGARPYCLLVTDWSQISVPPRLMLFCPVHRICFLTCGNVDSGPQAKPRQHGLWRTQNPPIFGSCGFKSHPGHTPTAEIGLPGPRFESQQTNFDRVRGGQPSGSGDITQPLRSAVVHRPHFPSVAQATSGRFRSLG